MVITREHIHKRRRITEASIEPTTKPPNPIYIGVESGGSVEPTSKASTECFVVDWGASMWRGVDTIGMTGSAQPTLVVYDKSTGTFKTGNEAQNATDYSISFEKLKSLFDLRPIQGGLTYREIEEMRIQKLGLDITIDDVLQKWWDDRMSPYINRIDVEKKVTIGIAHPAHFSSASVEVMRNFFATQCRKTGLKFDIFTSEEATAALHGTGGLTLEKGSKVLVVDGGKSTTDCALLEITSTTPSLTTVICATDGLPYGGNYINEEARRVTKETLAKHRGKIEKEQRSFFDYKVQLFWENFETREKRDLEHAKKIKSLEQIDNVVIDGLYDKVIEAARKLAQDTKSLIQRMIEGQNVHAIICLGGSCRLVELQRELRSLKPPPTFEENPLDGNTSDVLIGVRALALSPERAEWQRFPQNYLFTQDKFGQEAKKEGEKEAVLLCRQGQEILRKRDRRKLVDVEYEIRSRMQKSNGKWPYPGHSIEMSVWIEPEEIGEPVSHLIELRTLDDSGRLVKNSQGCWVCDLADTQLIRTYECPLPREVFHNTNKTTMYVYITGEGQDMLVTAVWLKPECSVDKDFARWMTLPEILGTLERKDFLVIETSVKVTAARKQR